MKVVIDLHVTGWKGLHEEELLKQYDDLLKVGQHSDLPQQIDDKTLGSYCKNNNCLLITSDKRAYASFFQKGTETIQISQYGFDTEANRPVFIIRILDGSSASPR